MRKQFPEYFPIDYAQLWKEGLFVFDANVFLDLYRYTEKTREDFLDLLDKMKKSIWVPHQYAHEYLKNRVSVIDQREKGFKEIIATLQKIKDDLSKNRSIIKSEENKKKIKAAIENSISAVQNELDRYCEWIEKDPVREKVSSLFDGCVGAPFSKENFIQMEKEARDRYEKKIPPGFEDKDRYGDAIGWFQIIEKARLVKKPIIFITGEEKADWWQIVGEKKIGPRTELIREIKEQALVDFHMYSLENFIRHANEKYKLDEGTLKELEELRKESDDLLWFDPIGSVSSTVIPGISTSIIDSSGFFPLSGLLPEDEEEEK